MSKKKPQNCRRITYEICDDVIDILNNIQADSIRAGKFRGRKAIIDRIIYQWYHSNLSLSDLGTDRRDTGSI
jgi:hypothetical protein